MGGFGFRNLHAPDVQLAHSDQGAGIAGVNQATGLSDRLMDTMTRGYLFTAVRANT